MNLLVFEHFKKQIQCNFIKFKIETLQKKMFVVSFDVYFCFVFFFFGDLLSLWGRENKKLKDADQINAL